MIVSAMRERGIDKDVAMVAISGVVSNTDLAEFEIERDSQGAAKTNPSYLVSAFRSYLAQR